MSKTIDNGVIHKIYGFALPNSYAEYLLLKRSLMKRDDDYVIRRFKKGDQLIFNTQFLIDILNVHGELHCEFCNKNLELIFWYDNFGNEDNVATADHFFPKSYDKENLAFEVKNMVVACAQCNSNKADNIIPINKLKYPYPHTRYQLECLKEKLNIN